MALVFALGALTAPMGLRFSGCGLPRAESKTLTAYVQGIESLYVHRRRRQQSTANASYDTCGTVNGARLYSVLSDEYLPIPQSVAVMGIILVGIGELI